ncbi:MAG: arsenate reductase family protein [Akkermansiaceae bacterium]|nr:arsenate reductase family protein [Akkermansiaceae bacterium]
MIKIYVYAKCSTCRKALEWLEGQGIPFEAHPIRETPPSIQELRHALDQFGGEIRKLFNTSGMDYRAMGLKDQLPTMGKDEALKLLHSNGNLVKRPLVIGKDFALAGFKPAVWQESLA